MSANLTLQSAHFSNWRRAVMGKGWIGHLGALGLAFLCVLMIFARDFGDMAVIWWTSSTFNHCVFIPFIAAWLVSQRRGEVLPIEPQAWLPGTILVLIAASVWMVGEAAGVAQLRHIGVVLVLQSCVLAVLGPNVTRALLFPLFYLSFMVPAGEELVPFLQVITAKMCMALLWVAGVPAYANGVFITIPNGYFEVAEACSGVKFLVAMIAYGVLVANVCFRTWGRRIAFMALAVSVPVIANGFRAFGTIYYAHLTTVESAAGLDHIVYGWFFFGFVIAATMALSWRFFDRGPHDLWLTDFRSLAWVRAADPRHVLIAGAVAVLAPVASQAVLSANGRAAMPHQIALPAVAGWRRVEAQSPFWTPHYVGADHRLDGHYQNDAGDVVDLSIVLYAWQEEGREVVGYGQGATGPDSAWTWTDSALSPAGGKAERIVTKGPINREVVSYFVTNKGRTGSASDVKIETLKSRLTGGNQAMAAILVSAVDTSNRPGRAAIDAFVRDMGSPDAMARHLIAQAQGR
jgi:exosortase A